MHRIVSVMEKWRFYVVVVAEHRYEVVAKMNTLDRQVPSVKSENSAREHPRMVSGKQAVAWQACVAVGCHAKGLLTS